MRRFLALAFLVGFAGCASAQDFLAPDNLSRASAVIVNGTRFTGVTGTGNTVALQTSPSFTTPSATNLTLTGNATPANGINLSGTNTLSLFNNSLETLRLQPTASAVNYAYIKGAATGGGGNRVTYGAAGSDTDVSVDFIAQGAGTINFNARGSNAGAIARFTSGTASAANGFNLQSAGTGVGPEISAFDLGGTGDSNIDINWTPKGSGLIRFNNSTSFSANGSVATVLGSLGPTGSHTTVQAWLTVKNSAGTTLYIPAF